MELTCEVSDCEVVEKGVASALNRADCACTLVGCCHSHLRALHHNPLEGAIAHAENRFHE